MSNENLRMLSETIRRRASRPSGEQYDEMIRRGALDQEGNVTVRRPEDPGLATGGQSEQEVADKPAVNIIAP